MITKSAGPVGMLSREEDPGTLISNVVRLAQVVGMHSA